jgi:tetratricopeptide (TPR) repeat protein
MAKKKEIKSDLKKEPSFSFRTWGTILFILLLTFLVYWGVNAYDYIHLDDVDAIVKNPQVAHGLSLKSIAWAFSTNYCYGYWMPLSWISFMFDVQLFGLNPGASHVINLLFHCANILLLFAVLKGLTGLHWQSAAVAACFALHPIHVESVVWISERKDVLSTFFWLLAMVAYIRFIKKRTTFNYSLLTISFVLGLCAKPMLVTLPFALLLIDFWPLGRIAPDGKAGFNYKNLKLCITEKLPLFFLSFIWVCITMCYMEPDKTSSFAVLALSDRIANALVSYCAYAGKIFYPVNLGIYYPHPYPHGFPLWKIAGAGVILAAVSVAAVRYVKKVPFVPAGWLWYLGTLVPVIGLAQTGSQAMADRFVYVPAIGIYIIIVWGISGLINASGIKTHPLFAGILAILAIALSIAGAHQRSYWKNSLSIFGHTLAVTTGNHIIHNNLGMILYKNGESDKALAHFQAALSANPDNEFAWNNLGIYYSDRDSVQAAWYCFSEAVRRKPNFTAVYYNLGKISERAGNDSNAILWYNKYLRFYPDHVLSLKSLGLIYIRRNDPDAALRYLNKAILLQPGSGEIHNSLGMAFELKNDYNSALQHFISAVENDPSAWQAFNNMGLVMMNQGNFAYAVRSFTEAIKTSTNNDMLFVNRGRAFAAAGIKENAKYDFQSALAINPDNIHAHAGLRDVFEKMGMRDSMEYHKKHSERK